VDRISPAGDSVQLLTMLALVFIAVGLVVVTAQVVADRATRCTAKACADG
jgi:multidrug efflux pump subunit AcrB